MSLPRGWISGKAGDLFKIRNGYAFKSKDFVDNGIPLVKQTNLNGKTVDFSKCNFLPNSYLEEFDRFALYKNDVLIGMSGSIGKLCIYDKDFPALQNQRTGKIELISNENTDWKFIWHYLNTIEKQLKDQSKGLAVANVSAKDIENLSLNIPPLNEQKRIAKKLDELLGMVERIKTRLDHIPAVIKRFRQSILAAATSGKLTEEWRRENGVSDEWEKLTVGDVADVGTGKTPLKSNTAYYSNGNIPWLTSSVTGNDFVRETDSYITQLAIDECKLKIYAPGTLLVAMYGEGKTRGQVTELTFPAAINQACAAITVDESKIEKAYFKLKLQENYAEIRMLAEGGNQPNLNLSKVKSIAVLVPSLEEQKEIVSRVESLFAIADTMEENLEAARKRVDRLSQSILAKAFRGELVPQDPNDEPAEKLLERIKAEQEASKPRKRSRKRK
jgi:type I restriction enzyme S subunit